MTYDWFPKSKRRNSSQSQFKTVKIDPDVHYHLKRACKQYGFQMGDAVNAAVVALILDPHGTIDRALANSTTDDE